MSPLATSPSRRIRVILAKPGMDSHFRGAIMVARYLIQQGMEVIYLGNQLPDSVADAAVQEDADVVGLSSLSGNHLVMVPRVIDALRVRGLSEAMVFVGGVIPPQDAQILLSAGVTGVFGTGSSLRAIASAIEAAVRLRRTDRRGPAESRCRL